jgi:hypothetical protein
MSGYEQQNWVALWSVNCPDITEGIINITILKVDIMNRLRIVEEAQEVLR